MKKLIFILIIIGACLYGFKSCINQLSSDEYENGVISMQPTGAGIYAKSRYIGSTESLNGNTCIITVYARENGQTDFSGKEKDNYRKSLNMACTYLSGKASEYGKEANFKCIEAFNGKTVYLNTLGENSYGISLLYMDIFGNDYAKQFHEMATENGCGNYMIMIYTNRTGCCNHAESSYCGSSFMCEGCVLNKQTRNNFTSTITHEMLHNFGAIDLYNANLSGISDSKSLDNSIMIRTDITLSKLNFDEITAYMVGLSDEQKPWYADVLKQYN